MRQTRKCLFIMGIMALSLALTIPAFGQPAAPTGQAPGPGVQTAPAGTVRGGGLMPDDVFSPIAKGYDLIREGNYAGARGQFETAVRLDKLNPFALNNLAVLDERDGKLNDALAHLKDALIHSDEYRDKVTQTCFVGGGCMAVKPLHGFGETGTAAPKSSITPVIQENIQKLEAKIAATKTPPPPGTPPPVVPPPKTK
jgi:tetratricopeptide (TPR) repeat protein